MSPENENAIARLVESGRFADREEALDAIVAQVREDDARRLERLRQKLRSAAEQDDRGEVTEIESEEALHSFFDEVKIENQAETPVL